MTDEEAKEIRTAIEALEAKREPVAWRSYSDQHGIGLWETKDDADIHCGNDSDPEPLYL